MEAEKRNHFKEVILQQIEDLKKDIENLKELAQPVSPDNAIGRISRMEALNDLTVHKSNLAKALKRQESLEKALTRVESEDYGHCLRCDEEINQKRLALLPESQICMVCIKNPPEE